MPAEEKSTSHLFTPVAIGGITLANRVAVSPMCQYSAENGAANDWHLQHLGSLSLSGAALVVVEQTAVEAAGRISHGCLGLYSDATEAALARVVSFCRRAGSASLGIQLAHAGRKGSAKLPWEGGGPLRLDAGAWTTAAPSEIPFDDGWPIPQALDEAGLARICAAHLEAARRAERLGFDLVELLGAHGFLLHSFLSPDHQPTHRFLWRQPRQPHALSARSCRRDPRGLAAPEGAWHADYRYGLG